LQRRTCCNAAELQLQQPHVGRLETRPPNAEGRSKITDKLNTEINAGLADPKLKARFADRGTVFPGSPADFGVLIAKDTEKWGRVIRSTNIKAN
jgi:hypothetical protein